MIYTAGCFRDNTNISTFITKKFLFPLTKRHEFMSGVNEVRAPGLHERLAFQTEVVLKPK